MEGQIQTLKERLIDIINLSYRILCAKIVGGEIIVDNESSLQLQFSILLNAIGQLYVFSEDEHFSVELEKKVNLINATCKSPKKKARCDIWLTIFDKTNKEHAAIELKYFRKSSGETITNNRFSVLCDLENLEEYKKENNNILSAFVLFTNNVNYIKTDTNSYINIGEGAKVDKNCHKSNNKEVSLSNEYIFNWDLYKNNYCFLKIIF